MTALNGENEGFVWTMGGSPSPYGGEAYDSDANIYLFRDYQNQYYGKKAIYRATLTDSNGEKAFDLIPVVKDGTPCMYDIVSGTLRYNVGNEDFIAGPYADDLVVMPADFTASAPTLSIAGLPVVVAGEVVLQDDYKSVAVGYDIRDTGAAATVVLSSRSDLLVARDASLPSLGEISASGEWRGDRVTISGTLESAGAGDCAITVETSRLGDFTDTVVWTADGTYASQDSFTVELYCADTTSPSYIVPGATFWYRVKATDRAGALDASVPVSVTTFGALSFGPPSVASAAGAFTVTVPITAIGANTNWAWVVYSTANAALGSATEKVVIPHDYAEATFAVDGVSEAVAPSTLTWALVVSNDCSTAVWVHTTTTQTKALANNFQYTWKAGVAAGIWEDAANWDAPTGRFQWPTDGSTACFPGNATASVAIASALVEVDGLYLDQPGLDVTFSGGRDRRLKVSSSLRANAAGGTICVSNLSFEVTYGGFEIGEGRTMVFHDAFVEIFNNGEFGARGGPNRRFVISGGTHLRSSGRMCVGGAGSEIVIDDSYVDLYVQNNGFFLASLAAGGEIILKGRNARLEAVSSGRNAGGMTNGGAIVFVIPEGGYASTPIKQVTNRHEANAWHLANPFADDGAYPSRIYPLTIRIDPDSPALRSNTSLTQPLIEWKSGINLQKALRAPLERPRRNAFVFSGAFEDHDDWSAEWTDTENAPLALGFRRMSGGTVLYLR